MEYYKIIRNGTIVGAGTTFLKWYPSKRQFFYCDIDSAERVQDFLTETMYHADWLRDAPSGATEALEADVRIIDATEYDEIIARKSRMCLNLNQSPNQNRSLNQK